MDHQGEWVQKGVCSGVTPTYMYECWPKVWPVSSHE